MPALILPLLLGTLLAGSAAQAATRPLHLVADQSGADVRLRVVGEAAAECHASYELTLASTTAAGSNRSVQRGAAHVRPGAAVTFATSTLRAGPGSWSARLAVRGCGTPDYVELGGAPTQAR